MTHLYRDIYSKLIKWKNSSQRKPLIIKGARQVGKTYIIKQFAQKEYNSYIYLNFEEDPNLKSLFQGDRNPKKIIENLSIYSEKQILPENTLIIFDEVQNSPETLTSLKYFCEENNNYHIISTGSLLGISLYSNKESSFPVGKVNFIQMLPLSFREFLYANKEDKLIDFLIDKKDLKPIPEAFHNKLLDYLKLYFFIGGMPEPIAEYITSKDFNNIRKIQKDILTAYAMDITRYALKNEAIKISEIWDSIPSQLIRENKKFKYSEIKTNAKSREYYTSIQWLINAGIVHQIYNQSIPKLPLSVYKNDNIFKLFLIDIGLLGAMLNLSPKTIIEGNTLFTHYNGAFTENYTAQELIVNNFNEIFYWTSKNNAEVDFLLSYQDNILPLEIKSGLNTKAKSLKIYGEKYNPPFLTRSSQRNFNKNKNLYDIPLYAISLLPQIYKL